jgi:hypothetical protein
MQPLVAALELFAGGSDRVSASELVALGDDRKAELARKNATSMIPRFVAEPAGETIRVQVPTTPPLQRVSPAPPLHVVPKTTVAPAAPASGWVVAVIVAVLAAVTVAVVLLR